MKKTYKITLPKGAKVNHTITQSVNGILEVTVNMEQKYVPEDGDVVYAQGERENYNWIFIYQKSKTDPYLDCRYYASLGIEHDGKPIEELVISDYCNTQDFLRPATEAEKQRLFDALAKEGKRWNAEKKCIEDLPRWRAQINEEYYFVDADCSVADIKEKYSGADTIMYEVGNYFRTREAAKKVALQIRDIFKNSKAE